MKWKLYEKQQNCFCHFLCNQKNQAKLQRYKITYTETVLSIILQFDKPISNDPAIAKI